jgi:hypothetical protein
MMKDHGHISFVLDILILKNYSQCIIHLSQKSYINKIESKFDIRVNKLNDCLNIQTLKSLGYELGKFWTQQTLKVKVQQL